MWWRDIGYSMAFGAAFAAACSASSSPRQEVNSSGGSGGTTGSGATGGSGVAGVSGNGIGGSSINTDSGTGGSNLNPDAACTGVNEAAETQYQPADIIWAVDTSCSMFEEAAFVQNNMNAFSQQIIASGIDVHVVLVSTYAICISPPLGAPGGCPSSMPGSDNNLPVFFHDHNPGFDPFGLTGGVQSTDGLNVLKKTFATWGGLLRAGASHWVVIVTDDDASDAPYGTAGTPAAGATQFINDFKALSPHLADFKMAGIYSHSACPSAANEGKVWREIISQTGGVHGDLCTQDFKPVFDELTKQVVTGSKPLECEWGIPPPPSGQNFDPSRVNVELSGSGGTETVFGVPAAGDCDPTLGGWYYDNPGNPTRVIACQATCDKIKTDTSSAIDIAFGCATIPIPK